VVERPPVPAEEHPGPLAQPEHPPAAEPRPDQAIPQMPRRRPRGLRNQRDQQTRTEAASALRSANSDRATRQRAQFPETDRRVDWVDRKEQEVLAVEP
jgi:hypothetical protein